MGGIFLFQKRNPGILVAGLLAGFVTGLFGAGGGMILVPLLTRFSGFSEEAIFPASLSIILPICLVSLILTALDGSISWKEAIPYLLGSALGGVIAGKWGRRIPVVWLHRGLGVLILWGGYRYLC